MLNIILDKNKEFDGEKFRAIHGDHKIQIRGDELHYPESLGENIDVSDCYLTQAEIDEPDAKAATVESVLAELDGLFVQDIPDAAIPKALRILFTDRGWCDSTGEIGK